VGDLGDVARDEGDYELALERYQRALAGAWQIGNQRMLVELLDGVAAVAASLRMASGAARLFGAGERLRELTGLTLRLPLDRAADEHGIAIVRADLGERGFAEAWLAGRELPPGVAVAEALAIERSERREAAPTTSPPIRLTRREGEIVRLLVAGKTDREIAAALFVSVRTVEHHVARIFGKLGVRTRTAAATAAIVAGLVAPAPSTLD
jgi:DNA-binding CsgD family transcriptional regulator